MKKTFALFVFVQSLLLNSYAQAQWNAVKVFDLDTDDFVYNIYIDSIETADGEPVFCFQTTYSKKLIKTNSKGEVIDVTDNPYFYFTILNGDTLLSGSVVKNTSGDTIAAFNQSRAHYGIIVASSLGIYVYVVSEVRNHYTHVVNYLNNKEILRTTYLQGMCCGGGGVYMLLDDYPDGIGRVIYYDEKLNTSTEALIPVAEPIGIAEYRGSLYVYSDVDEALYKLELSQGNDDFIYPFRLNYDVVPNRLFIELSGNDDTILDRINSLLNNVFDGNYQVVRWMWGAVLEVNANDSLIDIAISELLKDDDVIGSRRAYIERRDSERFLKSGSSGGLESFELYIDNNLSYEIKKCYNQSIIDSLSTVLGIYNTPSGYEPERKGMFHAPKEMDIFILANKLFESGYFTRIQLQTYNNYFPSSTSIPDMALNSVKVLEVVYYNLLGEKTNSPSGLTIVVTRYNDGSIRTEKKLFR